MTGSSGSVDDDNHDEGLIIVGIGASAGGLEALRQLVPKLPIDNRVVYILAQHLDPKHSSMLVPILARETHLQVNELQHDQVLETGQLYIIPPGMDAYYAKKRIFLEKATGIGPKPSVDRLLASLAENHGERSIGIILSGTGMDGAHGIRAIKAEGGITIAQLESTARFDSMPHAAINTGHVDLVLPPEDIAQQIQDLLSQPNSSFLFAHKPEPSEDEIQEILRLLQEQTGTDFRDYKRNTLLRRIERRMTVHKCKRLDEYSAFLKEKPEELYELHNDILISVTAFFRDTDAYQALHRSLEDILPQNGTEIRIWIAGCATGEEAYSIAIMLAEYLGNRITRYKVQIFGTDLYEGVLSIARQARYPKAAVAGIEPRLLDKYFIQKDGAYQLVQSIRNMVLFARHNLVRDPPFSHLNLVSCRNVLIYFNQNLQRKVLESFHYALETGAILLLGKSETIGNTDHLFTVVDRKARIYRRRGDVKGHLPYLLQHRHQREQRTAYQGAGVREKSQVKLQDVFDKLLVSIYQPACILLDDRQEIAYVRGQVDPFLRFMEGRAALSALELIRPELRQDMRGMLYKARRTDETLTSRRIAMRINGENVRVVMRVSHFPAGKLTENEVSVVIFEVLPDNDPGAAERAAEQVIDTIRLKELEDELRETRESLQTTIEELETSNEELQSTYEEAQSTNEELYTSTEELQTSNEELQSTNEELRTVNQEVSVKSAELEAANQQLKATNEQLTHEVEERKWAEARLEIERAKLDTIFQCQPNWINICTLDGTIQEVNPAGFTIMEVEHAGQLVGHSLKEYVFPEYVAEIEHCLTSIGQTGEVRKREVKIKTLKGNSRWLEIHSVLIHLADDELRIMSIIVDHTDRKIAQELLAERQQELAHIMRLNTLGEMASGIAHELNQPLSAIANYIRGCERRLEMDECSMDELREVMQLVSTQVRRAGDILRYAKDFTRKDQDVERVSCDINDVIQETLYLLETTEQFKEVKLVVELDTDLPKVSINKIQIEQVLINMVQNALDAMAEAENGKTGVLRIRTQKEGKHALRVLVVDQGTGLSGDFEVNIFRPFYTTKKNGMGMGLPISSSIIEAHGGKLEATNNLTKGSTFSFVLPL
ncbi:MAG: chemotaxis protein CheB [Thiothrix sp.]|uniref:chemotaxis protein CheB n=1 Tax=Thiothrix sp. TaxID=1032 RepID=UPI0026368478|nr:chemotaxis protein CheB [Thiothrix sp.]MDD5392720.1 chemotaxis protein CheB [Thiothrix sp.]